MPEKHTHKLRRHRYKSGSVIYFCVEPECNYKIAPAFALGKRTICHRCGESFIMNEYSVRLAKPHCDKCHKSKDGSIMITTTEPVLEIDGVVIGVQPTVQLSTNDLMSRLKAATTVDTSIDKSEDEDEI